jgi:hypothetical protein
MTTQEQHLNQLIHHFENNDFHDDSLAVHFIATF